MPKKILIVEDDESVLKLECIILTAKGYFVHGAMNGVAALDDIFADRPDLIMLDIMLPGVDGFEICRRIKKNPATSQIPVIFVSAKNAPEDIIRGKLVGGDEYITKPFKSSKVLSAVKMLLDNDVSPPQKQECLH